MKRVLSSILIFSLSLFTLIGCGKADKPTVVVNNYFSNIRSEANSNLEKNVISSILTNEDEAKTKEATDALSAALSKLEVEPEKETIDSNSATVSVKVKGISLSSVTLSLIDEIQKSSELSKLNKEDKSKKITEILIDKIKNAEVEERAGQLDLKKENNEWTINTENDNFFETVFGATEDQIKKLQH